MRIFEFHPSMGTFSMGFEYFDDHEVVSVQKISKNELISYNSCHKHKFRKSNLDFIDVSRLKDHEIGILHPDFGVTFGQKFRKDPEMDELYSCLRYISSYQPKIVIIITPTLVIPRLNTYFNYVTDGFGMASKDIVIASLQNSGYRAWQFVLDQVQYGVPMYSDINFYIGVHQSLSDAGEFNKTQPHRGITNGKMPYTTILEAIGDLPCGRFVEYNQYAISPNNSYQAWCRRNCGDFVFNNQPIYDNQQITDILDDTKEGNIPDTFTRGRRAILRRPARIYNNFHLIRGAGSCIHPIEPRAFTIREGARLHGIPDYVKIPDIRINKQADLIHRNVSPIMGAVIKDMLRSYLL